MQCRRLGRKYHHPRGQEDTARKRTAAGNLLMHKYHLMDPQTMQNRRCCASYLRSISYSCVWRFCFLVLINGYLSHELMSRRNTGLLVLFCCIGVIISISSIILSIVLYNTIGCWLECDDPLLDFATIAIKCIKQANLQEARVGTMSTQESAIKVLLTISCRLYEFAYNDNIYIIRTAVEIQAFTNGSTWQLQVLLIVT